jgi:hypothetical protein
MPIPLKRHKHSDLGEGFQSVILIGAEHRHHGVAQRLEIAQERSRLSTPV